MDLLDLNDECLNELCSFLDYESFCSIRLTCRLARHHIGFQVFQDWKGAIESTLLATPTPREAPSPFSVWPVDAILNDVDQWIKHGDGAVFCVHVNGLGSDDVSSVLCSGFDPNQFQKSRCRNCMRMKQEHGRNGRRRKGGVLGVVQRDFKKERLLSEGIKGAKIPSAPTRELFHDLCITLQFTHRISSQMRDECRHWWDWGTDSVECYLIGPVVVKDGKVQPLKLLIDVSFYCGGLSKAIAVEGCSLDVLYERRH